MVIHHGVAAIAHQIVALGDGEVFADHFRDEFVEAEPGRPAEFFARLGGVTEEGFDFGGAEVAGVYGDDDTFTVIARAGGPWH
ncbi:hypothetical protein THITH_05650 [Thioalkalivibrio paradoxus ARh 1]|uniref:Uncharacterized protein n=1 Tax=Thioalkalivibrio paradoxus ARh 1 TaxID=713585 RepID=W0DRT8_9GAMM|nr:hypothetical protein THITH_05650 [Thioalkalivibrio paradoxus ARh 1]